MSDFQVPDFLDKNPDAATVGDVVDAYLAMGTEGLSTHNVGNIERLLPLFADEIGRNRLVKDCKPILLKYWFQHHPELKSDWTIKRCAATIKRAFSWAFQMGMTNANPIQMFRHKSGERGRPMTDKEFRACLRDSEPLFRRALFFLHYTGCRPGEMSKLRWQDVDLEKGIAALKEHKTSKKTGKPRTIYLAPLLVRLLRWIKRQPSRTVRRRGRLALPDVCRLIRQMLTNGPLLAQEVFHRLRPYRVSWATMARAANAIGVETLHLGYGRTATYQLPINSMPGPDTEPPELAPSAYVFLNERGNPWRLGSLAWRMVRLRERLGLPKDCKLYGLRHRFCTVAIQNNTPIKLVAELAGHASVTTTEHYIHMENMADQLHQALLLATRSVEGQPKKEGAG